MFLLIGMEKVHKKNWMDGFVVIVGKLRRKIIGKGQAEKIRLINQSHEKVIWETNTIIISKMVVELV
jgi:hypothetical protein